MRYDEIQQIIPDISKYFDVPANFKLLAQWHMHEGIGLIESIKNSMINIDQLISLINRNADSKEYRRLLKKEEKQLEAYRAEFDNGFVTRYSIEKFDSFCKQHGIYISSRLVENQRIRNDIFDTSIRFAASTNSDVQQFWADYVATYNAVPFVLWREGSRKQFKILPSNLYISLRPLYEMKKGQIHKDGQARVVNGVIETHELLGLEMDSGLQIQLESFWDKSFSTQSTPEMLPSVDKIKMIQ